MKKALLWLLQAHIYLIPVALIAAGIFIFVLFIPKYAAVLTISWILIVSYFYIKYDRWY